MAEDELDLPLDKRVRILDRDAHKEAHQQRSKRVRHVKDYL